jgi:hypothetical protein
MKDKNPGHVCCCPCHDKVTIHITTTCECGKPVTPPDKKDRCKNTPKCPPPESRPQPGTVDIPQTPPPTFETSDVPPWKEGKPKPGDAGEIPWFKNKVKEILRKGPTFGPRKDEFLPYLLVRSASSDRGKRRLGGVFWESPDIFVAPNQGADSAPLMPAALGSVAQANAPNTVYAHIWNLGKAPAHRVRVEFYWFNPTLGISWDERNSIGATYIDLANRFTLYPKWVEVIKPYGRWITRGSHAIVHCPNTWIPQFVNNGHECLVVRAFEPIFDALVPQREFSAASNRHVAQRNIAVVRAASPASIDLALNLGYPEAPAEAEVEVSAHAPGSMEWLQLYSGARTPHFRPPKAQVFAGLLPPAAHGTRISALSNVPFEYREALLKTRETFQKGCCPLQIAFHGFAANLNSNEAQIFRVRQRVDGNVIGGYTVVLLK